MQLPPEDDEEYLHALRDERRKIEAFKRELPCCMDLLEKAIAAARRRLRSGTASEDEKRVRASVQAQGRPLHKRSANEDPSARKHHGRSGRHGQVQERVQGLRPRDTGNGAFEGPNVGLSDERSWLQARASCADEETEVDEHPEENEEESEPGESFEEVRQAEVEDDNDEEWRRGEHLKRVKRQAWQEKDEDGSPGREGAQGLFWSGHAGCGRQNRHSSQGQGARQAAAAPGRARRGRKGTSGGTRSEDLGHREVEEQMTSGGYDGRGRRQRMPRAWSEGEQEPGEDAPAAVARSSPRVSPRNPLLLAMLATSQEDGGRGLGEEEREEEADRVHEEFGGDEEPDTERGRLDDEPGIGSGSDEIGDGGGSHGPDGTDKLRRGRVSVGYGDHASAKAWRQHGDKWCAEEAGERPGKRQKQAPTGGAEGVRGRAPLVRGMGDCSPRAGLDLSPVPGGRAGARAPACEVPQRMAGDRAAHKSRGDGSPLRSTPVPGSVSRGEGTAASPAPVWASPHAHPPGLSGEPSPPSVPQRRLESAKAHPSARASGAWGTQFPKRQLSLDSARAAFPPPQPRAPVKDPGAPLSPPPCGQPRAQAQGSAGRGQGSPVRTTGQDQPTGLEGEGASGEGGLVGAGGTPLGGLLTPATQPGGVNRKARRCWSAELHRRFVDALEALGGQALATPKMIREWMQVDGLTNDEVKSHLQKYRLHNRRPSAANSEGASSSDTSSQVLKAATPAPLVLGTTAPSAELEKPVMLPTFQQTQLPQALVPGALAPGLGPASMTAAPFGHTGLPYPLALPHFQAHPFALALPQAHFEGVQGAHARMMPSMWLAPDFAPPAAAFTGHAQGPALSARAARLDNTGGPHSNPSATEDLAGQSAQRERSRQVAATVADEKSQEGGTREAAAQQHDDRPSTAGKPEQQRTPPGAEPPILQTPTRTFLPVHPMSFYTNHPRVKGTEPGPGVPPSASFSVLQAPSTPGVGQPRAPAAPSSMVHRGPVPDGAPQAGPVLVDRAQTPAGAAQPQAPHATHIPSHEQHHLDLNLGLEQQQHQQQLPHGCQYSTPVHHQQGNEPGAVMLWPTSTEIHSDSGDRPANGNDEDG